MKARIMAPAEYIGPIMTLGTERRGVYKNMTYLDTQPRRVRLGVSARRDHPRLLRQAEDDQPRLREPRLRHARVSRERSREARHADQRRPDRRVLGDHPPRQVVRVGPQDRRQAEGADSAAAVRGRDPGGDRQQGHRAHDGEGAAQGRAREVLRRRHHAKAQAPREAEGRQEAHEAGRRRSRFRRKRFSRCCRWIDDHRRGGAT